jgi:ElaB/YqjD/DUF883 family membrane-anchored ribosome-binding protein
VVEKVLRRLRKLPFPSARAGLGFEMAGRQNAQWKTSLRTYGKPFAAPLFSGAARERHWISNSKIMKTRAKVMDRHLAELRESIDELKERTVAVKDAALNVTRTGWHEVQDRTVVYSKKADETVRSHVYASLGTVFCAGVALGMLFGRGNGSRSEELD